IPSSRTLPRPVTAPPPTTPLLPHVGGLRLRLASALRRARAQAGDLRGGRHRGALHLLLRRPGPLSQPDRRRLGGTRPLGRERGSPGGRQLARAGAGPGVSPLPGEPAGVPSQVLPARLAG